MMKIDESKMKENPGILQRIKYAILSGLWALALSFVLLMFIPFIHFFVIFPHPLYITYIVLSMVAGYFLGDRFIETMAVKTDDWFDIRRFFRF